MSRVVFPRCAWRGKHGARASRRSDRDFSSDSPKNRAGFGSAEAAFADGAHRVVSGADALARSIAAELGDRIRLETPVTAVTVTHSGCAVTTASKRADGADPADRAGWAARTERADSAQDLCSSRVVVVAVPVNCLGGIVFEPVLELPGPHAGRVTKTWSRVDGVPAHAVCTGWPGLVETYTVPGASGVALAAFRLSADVAVDECAADGSADLTDAYPDAEFHEELGHDWCADPYSLGTWCTSRPGQFGRWQALADQAGPVFFSGGDISRRWMGWMDGAITSGTDTAARVLAHLDGDVVPPARG